MSKTFEASSTLIGTAIGAGILGIPFVVMKAGFPLGLFHLILVATIIIITHLYLGEINLRTKKPFQLAGLAEKYLGKKGKSLMMLAFTFGIYSAMLAYLIGEGRSLSFLFFGSGQYEFLLGLAFWAFLSTISYRGVKALKDGEPIGVTIILILIISISVLFWNKIDPVNLTYTNLEYFYVPFGVILFAFLGFAAIPEVEKILGKEKKSMLKTIWISNIIILLVYAIFAAVVVGSQGINTPQVATIALGKPFILLGIITMFTSYLALSVALTHSIETDYKKSKLKAWLITILVPLAAYIILTLLKSANFITILGIGGVISGGITAVLILLMAKQAKIKGDEKPAYEIPYSKILTIILIVLFSIATVLEILSALKII